MCRRCSQGIRTVDRSSFLGSAHWQKPAFRSSRVSDVRLIRRSSSVGESERYTFRSGSTARRKWRSLRSGALTARQHPEAREAPTVDTPRAVKDDAHGFGIREVFLLQDACRQRAGCIGVEHGHGPLQDNRAGIEVAGNEMHGHAAHFDSVLERLALRVDSWKRWQQGRVNIQNGVGKGIDQWGADYAHEAGETDQIDLTRLELPNERAVVVVSRWPTSMTQDGRLNPGETCAVQSARTFLVRDHNGDGRLQSTVANRIDERLQIGPAAGNQNAKSVHARLV